MTDDHWKVSGTLTPAGSNPGAQSADPGLDAIEGQDAEYSDEFRARVAESERAAMESRQQMVKTVISSAEDMASAATKALSRPVFLAQFVGLAMVFGAFGLTIAQGVYGPYDQNAFLTTTQFVTLIVAGSALILGGPVLLARRTRDQDAEKSKQLEAVGAQPKTEFELLNEALKRSHNSGEVGASDG